MADYVAPLQDMRFVLKDVIGLETVSTLAPFTEVTEDVVDAILEEAARFAQEVLSPIIAIALEKSKLQEFTGRDKPTVIT